MFKSIVVAVDGSAHAARALEMGSKLAARDKVPLGIIYVVDTYHMEPPSELLRMAEVENIIKPVSVQLGNLENAPTKIMLSVAEATAESQKRSYQLADFIIRQAETRARKLGVEDIERKLVVGNPAEEILVFIDSRNADLIVTGRRGFSPIKSLLLGSTSNKISQLAECNCLTVK